MKIDIEKLVFMMRVDYIQKRHFDLITSDIGIYQRYVDEVIGCAGTARSMIARMEQEKIRARCQALMEENIKLRSELADLLLTKKQS